MRLLESGIVEGNLNPDMMLLHAYGIYLGNGGRPEDFDRLSMQDIQIMYSVHIAEIEKVENDMLKALAKMHGGEYE